MLKNGVPPKYTLYTSGDETKVLAFKANSIKDIFIQGKKKIPICCTALQEVPY